MGLNISTKSLVNYHLEALETAALITRVPNTPRGLRLNIDSEAEKTPSSPKVDQAATEFPNLSQDEIIELTYGTVTNDNNLFALKIDDQSAGDVAILQRKSKVQNGDQALFPRERSCSASLDQLRQRGYRVSDIDSD